MTKLNRLFDIFLVLFVVACNTNNNSGEGVLEKSISHDTLYYENGDIFRIDATQKGIKNGLSRMYYSGSQLLQAKGYFKNDSANGEWNFYGEGGSLRYILLYDNGRKVKGAFYREDGSVYLVDHIDSNYTKTYDETGHTLSMSFGNGMHKEYDTSGTLIVEGYFKNWKPDSVWKFFDASGVVIKTIKYRNGIAIDSAITSDVHPGK